MSNDISKERIYKYALVLMAYQLNPNPEKHYAGKYVNYFVSKAKEELEYEEYLKNKDRSK